MTGTTPVRILETAVYVDDLDAAESFYGGLLGLEKVGRVGNRHIFYRCGPGMLLVFNPEETRGPAGNPALPVPPHGTVGEGHMCFAADAARLEALAGLFARQANGALAGDLFEAYGQALEAELGISLDPAVINAVHAQFP